MTDDGYRIHPRLRAAMTDESEGLRIARDRIAREAEERTGFLDLRGLGLSNLPTNLYNLEHLLSLNCSNNPLSNLTPLSNLANLQSLNFSETAVYDLEKLSGLTSLKSLNCAGTLVDALAPLSGLSSLQSLDCTRTGVRDLASLSCLTNLQVLNCSLVLVSDLAPLTGLTSLVLLDCSATLVNNIVPLICHANLQSLDCSRTGVRDLVPLSGCANLHSLNCSWTLVRDLAPLSGLSNLQSLDCSRTWIRELAPLSSLPNIRLLDCSHTSVSDLTPIAGLENLQKLTLVRCGAVLDLPYRLVMRQSLQELHLFGTRVRAIPAEVLQQAWGESNCLQTIRSHVLDLEADALPVRDVKVLVLGNGSVGKTQLCRRLRGDDYDDSQPTTHGIVTMTAPLPDIDGGLETTLQIWDFGGQDLYHGTHALFMRANALFLLVWTPELEDTREIIRDGIAFRNHPLAYWVEYVRHLGGKQSAVVVVQTRCDSAVDEAPCPVPETNLFAEFGFPPRSVRYSSLNNRGRAALDAALAEAASWLRGQEGIATIGAGRHRVKEKLEALRVADTKEVPVERQHRTITQDFFRRLCEESGGVSSPQHLLAYLHDTGIVFYRDALFEDNAIILDREWALRAIYAVFHREKCYTRIRRNRGRFTRSDLAEWVWAEHDEAEQKLFLSMMKSCGICFVHRTSADSAETEYIAPDLLPERQELEAELAAKWDGDRPIEKATFTYTLFHAGLIRGIISRIGQEAGIAADYWQGGVYVYETTTGSRGIIEAEMLDSWCGRIRLQTQRGRAAELLARLRALVEEEQNKAGLTPVEAGLREAKGETAAATLKVGQEPSPLPEWCVSYAWGDTTPEGRDREQIVDALCLAAEQRGKKIIRDKTAMGLGERISKFMQRIGRADRVFLILSDKYLKSSFCMFELSEVWRNCREEEGGFLERIRVYTQECATIWSPEERLAYAIHWKERFERMEAMVKQHGYDILGERDGQEFRRMRDFSRNVGDILATVADTLQPKDFDELVRSGLDD